MEKAPDNMVDYMCVTVITNLKTRVRSYKWRSGARCPRAIGRRYIDNHNLTGEGATDNGDGTTTEHFTSAHTVDKNWFYTRIESPKKRFGL